MIILTTFSEYFWDLLSKIVNSKNNVRHDENIQEIYDKFGYGYSEKNNNDLLYYLREYNRQLKRLCLATGQYKPQTFNSGSM